MIGSLRLAAVTLMLAVAALGMAQRIKVQVDGNAVYFPNAKPQYINGRVLVPLRGVFEELGATVTWDQQTRMVSAHRGDSDVELRIGDPVATVNGTTTHLDVPAMIVNGSTMVPIRFVSEALGAQVGWLEAQHLVMITTNSAQNTTIPAPTHHLRKVVVHADEVIPITLDQPLSTVDNQKGDTFTATVRTSGADSYGDIPQGAVIEGHIAALHRMNGDKPAILDLAFDRMRLPDGRTVRIDGSLTSLDNKHVTQGDNGTLIARTDPSSNQDQRMVYAGYGAGAGLLLGVLTKRPLEDTILGGALGYILGQVKHDQRRPSEVSLDAGTQMGVRINHTVTAPD